MGYAALMVHVEPCDAAEPRIRLAADLADRFDAALIGFAGAAVMPPPVTAPVFGPAVAVEVLEAEQRRVEAALHAAHERFRTIAERDRRRTGWRSFLDHPAAALAREARAADLLIAGRGGAFGFEHHQTVDPGDLLMRAGRPVLVVPAGVAVLEARRVLVAWKDTREARRAVADALPLLADAEEVLVAEAVTDEAGEREAALRRTCDVAALLERHGATARGETLEPRGGRAMADELLRAAERHGADLVVAGGYGHARLREWAFGGVTRDLLARCPVCCLLSH